MICVTLTSTNADELLAQHRRLTAEGAELVEWRLDFLPPATDVAALVGRRPGPIVATCRRPADGGKYAGDEETRRAILRQAIAAGAEYVDLEEDAAAGIARGGRTRRIVSHHDFQRTPADLAGLHRRLAALDADVVKLCTMAACQHDNLRMLELVDSAAVPTVGFCMGQDGVPSRLLVGKYGGPFTFACADEAAAAAPGQLPFRQMKELYRYDQIDRQTEIFGVIADPVGHSLSPLIHNAAFAREAMNRVYLPFRVGPDELPQFLDDAVTLGVRGLSITIPHKEAVLPKLAWAEDAVRGIGACNTAVYEGGWRGWNTDSAAAMESIEEALAGRPLAGRTALVLGAGGAGKAVAVGLLARGAQVAVSDGDQPRAAALAQRLGCRVVAWSDRRGESFDVLCNCTPLGMSPKVDQTPFEAEALPPAAVVFDAVYNPEQTRLLTDARNRGCTTVSGVEMFVRQACLQFTLFTGRPAPAELMRQTIRQAMAARH